MIVHNLYVKEKVSIKVANQVNLKISWA
uniref:Uncharacterized protein n=1 Tax=Tetranychus urticae TaxID=32264 RepID=T1JXJ3_TETUR